MLFTLCTFKSTKTYPKIPKISAGAYIFQSRFWRGLFLEAPIFGGAYVRREIYVSKSIGLALLLSFLLCYTLYSRANWRTSPSGGLYSEGRFKGGLFALRFWGPYIWRGLYGGAYFRNFTVAKESDGLRHHSIQFLRRQ